MKGRSMGSEFRPLGRGGRQEEIKSKAIKTILKGGKIGATKKAGVW